MSPPTAAAVQPKGNDAPPAEGRPSRAAKTIDLKHLKPSDIPAVHVVTTEAKLPTPSTPEKSRRPVSLVTPNSSATSGDTPAATSTPDTSNNIPTKRSIIDVDNADMETEQTTGSKPSKRKTEHKSNKKKNLTPLVDLDMSTVLLAKSCYKDAFDTQPEPKMSLPQILTKLITQYKIADITAVLKERAQLDWPKGKGGKSAGVSRLVTHLCQTISVAAEHLAAVESPNQ